MYFSGENKMALGKVTRKKFQAIKAWIKFFLGLYISWKAQTMHTRDGDCPFVMLSENSM